MEARSASRPASARARAEDFRGLVIGVPHRFSMQYYLVCDWLARGGVDPLRDVSIREIPPPRMPRGLERGRIDAAMAPEPYAELIVERGVGSFVLPSSEMWAGHPCCSFTLAPGLAEQRPGVAAALVEAVVEAELDLARRSAEERRGAAQEITRYFPLAARAPLEKALASDPLPKGARASGERLSFAPTPFVEYGVWILAQMQRLGQIAGELDHRARAADIFAPAIAREALGRLGAPPGAPNLEGMRPFCFEDPLSAVRRAPFCAYRAERPQKRSYGLPVEARARLAEILDKLADVAGGSADFDLHITSDDELGDLERALGEALRARSFVEEALVEQHELEEQAARQEALISAQRALIREIGAPIVPVLPGLLLLPLVGEIDAARAADIEQRALDAAFRSGARAMIVDVTGARINEREALALVLRLTRALALLGAECVLVGVSPSSARALAAKSDSGSLPRCARDLSTVIARRIRAPGLTR